VSHRDHSKERVGIPREGVARALHFLSSSTEAVVVMDRLLALLRLATPARRGTPPERKAWVEERHPRSAMEAMVVQETRMVRE
jgi:hypothetical protein